MQRRNFLSLAASASLLTHVGSFGMASALELDDCGVASGDPTASSLVLWTRIPKAFQDPTATSQQVRCEVSLSADNFENERVFEAWLSTSALKDFTAKLRVENLQPFTRYFYRFTTTSGYTSVVGRGLTTPCANMPLESLKLAYVSCQDFTAGYYGVYQALAADDLHFCVHLGDTIYEYGSKNNKLGPARQDNIGGGEAKTLDEYRAKYKLYLTDAAFREARRMFTWICLPDDHEVRNDYTGLDPALRLRREGAYTAYFEFNPLDDALFQNGLSTFARRVDLGSLATLYALDERQFRDFPACKKGHLTQTCEERDRPGRTMLGKLQLQNLKKDLIENKSTHKVLLSEVMMMSFYAIRRPDNIARTAGEDSLTHSVFADRSVYSNLDGWDGFPSERSDILQVLLDNNIKNVHVWTGDIHNCYAGQVLQDNSPAATEVVVGSVTSSGFGEVFPLWSARAVEPLVKMANPHMAYADLITHMYMRVELTPTHARYDAMSVPSIRQQRVKPYCSRTLFVAVNQTQIVLK